jgi:hypothetical protein
MMFELLFGKYIVLALQNILPLFSRALWYKPRQTVSLKVVQFSLEV